MLMKLTRYEIKATARQFLPLYGALIVMSIIMRIFFSIGIFSNDAFFDAFSGAPIIIGMLIYFALIIAVAVLTFVVMLQRFYKNLLSDEGYLMFTLPVHTWELISCKVLTTLLWGFMSGVVTILTILILSVNTQMLPALSELFHELFGMMDLYSGINLGLLVIELTLLAIVSAVGGILLVYASISLGHLFNSHRIFAAFGAYLVLNTITSTISSVMGSIASTFDSESTMLPAFSSNLSMFHLAHTMLLPTLVLSALYAVGLFCLTNYILTKKLNLE